MRGAVHAKLARHLVEAAVTPFSAPAAHLNLWLDDAKELVEVAVDVLVEELVIVAAARRFWQLLDHFSVLDAIDWVVAAGAALRALVERNADVVAVVLGDGARLAVGENATADAGRHLVVPLDVVAGCADHGFLHACAAVPAGSGMVRVV